MPAATAVEEPTPVCVLLKNMIDIALGTPEVGVVNFNLINSILHVIVAKLSLQDVKVEIRGEEAAALRCLIETGQISPSVQVSEYVIEQKDNKQKDNKLQAKTSEIITVVEKKVDESAAAQRQAGGQRLSVPTSSQYNILDKKVSKLEQKVNDVHQKNSDILKRSKSGSKSVTEMWQMVNLVARIDAAEQGVSKMSSLIEDLAMEVEQIASKLGHSGTKLSGHHQKDSRKLSLTRDGAGGKATSPRDGSGGKSGSPRDGSDGKSGSPRDGTSGKSGSPRDGTSRKSGSPREGAHGKSSSPRDGSGGRTLSSAVRDTASESSVENIDNEYSPRGGKELKKSKSIMALIGELLGDMGVLKEEVKNLNELFNGFKAGGGEIGVGDASCSTNDEKFCEMNQAIVRIDNAFNSQMNYYQDKLTDLESEVMNMMQCMQETRSLSGQVSTLEEYSTKLQAVLEDIQSISTKTNILMDEKEERAKEIELIQEELECLKHYKADIRDVEEALDEKADLKLVNKKVSVEQFSCAFKNVCESLNELYTKMTNQEITWRNALDDIMRDLQKKIDRNEAITMHEEIYEKVKKLHERLKILETAKKEAEAAGSKSKYLRNVNCISCDNRVVMQKTETGTSTFKSWPQKGNAVPYVCCDTEFLKKLQQKVCSCGREGCSGNHECNRYCGGSHTKITQEQRMKQKGNIVNQFNLIEVPADEQAAGHAIKPRAPAMQDQGIMANLGGDTGLEVIMPPKKFFDCSEFIFGDVGQEPSPKKRSPRDECGEKKRRLTSEKVTSAHSVSAKRRSVEGSKTKPAEKSVSKLSVIPSKKFSVEKSPNLKKSTSAQGVEAPSSKTGSAARLSAKSTRLSKQPSVTSKKASEGKVGSKAPSAEKIEEAPKESEPPAEPAAESEPVEEPAAAEAAPAEEAPPEEAPAEPAPEE